MLRDQPESALLLVGAAAIVAALYAWLTRSLRDGGL